MKAMGRRKRKPQDKLEELLLAFAEDQEAVPREHRIKETAEACAELVSASGSGAERLSYWEFFRMQVRLIQKRWWLMQAALLTLVWLVLDASEVSESMQRAMSVAAVLFVILIMPEIWKNRETNSMEIEKASFYSLRQIYSAKLLAFGLVDACIVNVFCFTAAGIHQIPVYDLLKQFIFPLMVATGICFSIFCSKRQFGEMTAVFACAITNGIWTLAIINEAVYARITSLLWGVLFTISGAVVVFSIRKTICGCDTLWEVNRNDINFG